MRLCALRLAAGCLLATTSCVSAAAPESSELADVPAESPAAEAESPAAEVAEQMQTLFHAIWALTRDAELPAARKRDGVEALVSSRLDDSTLSRAALGSLAKQFTREQYGDFAYEYSRYVTSLLVARFARYPEHPVEVESASYDAEGGSVRIRARGSATVAGVAGVRRLVPRERIPLELQLRQRHGEWRVGGVVMNRVDASRSFRDQFRSVLERSDPDALITELRERNQQRAEENPFDR